MKSYTIFQELYSFKFKVFIGELDDLNSAREKKGLSLIGKISKAVFTLWYDKRYGEFYLQPNAENSLIAHESTHAALYIYHQIGQGVDTNNNEDIAYLIGWMVGKIDQCFDKYEKANKKNIEIN